MCGTTTTKRRRSLTHGRQLVLSTLQNHPELAQNMQVSTPECDFDKCTSCGECVNACPTSACDLVGSGRFALESTYCLGCGACVKVCPEHALKLVEHDASNLVVADPEAEEKAAQKAKAHEEAEKVKAEAKAKLDKMLDRWKSSQTSQRPLSLLHLLRRGVRVRLDAAAALYLCSLKYLYQKELSCPFPSVSWACPTWASRRCSPRLPKDRPCRQLPVRHDRPQRGYRRCAR